MKRIALDIGAASGFALSRIGLDPAVLSQQRIHRRCDSRA